MDTDLSWDALPSACGHWPPMLAVIPTGRGYKVRCLTCGQTGPERESTDLAWAALAEQSRATGVGEASTSASR